MDKKRGLKAPEERFVRRKSAIWANFQLKKVLKFRSVFVRIIVIIQQASRRHGVSPCKNVRRDVAPPTAKPVLTISYIEGK